VRIKRLAITGFGPYKGRQTVDFEGFEGDGLFLITGRTGAGKSSILDAICFALYGSIPRFEGTQQRLRSDHCEPDDATLVELQFAVDGRDYRVVRSPEYERPKARGVGMMTQKPTAELGVLVGDTWTGVAARPVDVGHELARIVGLTKEQFLQVILLAQNRFQEFLLAKNDERQRVLRSLFGTHRFLDFETALVDRRKQLDARLAEAGQARAQDAARVAILLGIDAPPEPTLEWFDEALDSLLVARDAAARVASEADAAATAADLAHRALEMVHGLQVRRTDALARLALLGNDRDAVDGKRQALDAATRAAAVWPQLTTATEAGAALVGATEGEAAARARYARLGAGTSTLTSTSTSTSTGTGTSTSTSTGPENPSLVTEAAVRASIDETTRLLGTLDAALTDESSLPGLTADITTAELRLGELTRAIDDLVARSGSLPHLLEAHVDRLGALRVRAAAHGDAAAAVERETSARAAAVEAASLEPQLASARAAEVASSAQHTSAATLIQQLLERRLAGHAGELAAQLNEGDACAVCGSTEHPRPASGGTDPVTADDIERARAAADQRRTELDASHERALALEHRLTEVRAMSGGVPLDRLDTQLEAASTRLDDAVHAAAEASTLDTEVIRVRAEIAESDARLAALRTDRDAASVALLRLQGRLATIDDRVSSSRGEFTTVGERAAELTSRLAAARELEAAIALTAVRTDTAERAVAVLRGQLADRGFADADSAAAARLDPAQMAAAQRRIRAFDDTLAAAEATLAEPEVLALPGVPADLAPATAALSLARAARDEAISARNGLADRARQLEGVVADARRRLAASGDLADEHRQLRGLADTVEGSVPNEKRMRLETYVLAARLEEIVAAANARLRTMTSGRYTLEHDDALQFRGVKSGLGLAIRDEHTGRARATHSLSGGETFLSSLALALGLAEVVTSKAGGIRLDTLFIDEGFGSLDADTLDIAMSTLDSLRAGGRTIGLISHVEAMKEQIPAHLAITVEGNGWSEIQASYAPA